MSFTLWFLIVGTLFVVMALAGSVLKRLPLTTSMLYMAVGLALSPLGLGLLQPDPLRHAELLERLTEIAVLISLFTAGLKLRTPLSDGRWHLPARLAFGAMLLTVGLITLAGVFLLRLPLGAAVLLGAILAPTDPVLASDVQVEHPEDRDRLRFALTGEAGLNDGTAFPFVMLGLGLLGLHELGGGNALQVPWRWILVDVLWAVPAGLGIGWLLGTLVGRLVLYLRRKHKEAVGLDDFLCLGLIALAYGAALLAVSYGFLAVFAAGLALRRVEMRSSEQIHRRGAETQREPETRNPKPETQNPKLRTRNSEPETQNPDPQNEHAVATDPTQAPAYLAQAVLGFNEQLERIGEVGVVLVLGALLAAVPPPREALWFVPLLLLVIRPVAVWLGLIGSRSSGAQRRLIAWFGVRGIGSLYYLMYAIVHGLPDDLAARLTGLTLAVVAASIVLHGISVTPLMKRYSQQREQGGGTSAPAPEHSTG